MFRILDPALTDFEMAILNIACDFEGQLIVET